MIWIARPRLYLPARLQRKLEEEERWSGWRRRFWKMAAATSSVVLCNFVALEVAFQGGGKWAVLPAVLSVLPLMWLFDKVAFGSTSELRQPQAVESDMPGLILP